ncbi:MAG: SprB repeat-containing protein, partial [Saprospiraceae bacterium]
MRNFTPQVEGNIRTRTDFLISSILVQTCWILLLYLFMYSSAYAHTSLNLSDGRFFQTTMCDNAIEGGEISGDERGCDDPVFDPTMIQNVTLPTGGTGTLEYLWIFTTDDPEAEFSVWTPIMNTNAPTYNPPAITETTYYRRCARRSGCDDYVVESNYVTKEVACCDNVTDGGSIRADQTSCSDTYDPQPLLNVNLPMGGSGDIEYLWFASNVGPPFFPESPNWTEIIGSNNMSYDPGIITETTYYIRCSRRLGCVTFTGESNIVEITLSNPLTINVMSTPPSCSMQNNGSIRLQVIGGAMPFDYFWTNGIGNTGNPTNLSAGTYAVTVTDNNGCENSTQITLNEPNPLQLDLSSTDAGCGNENNGSVSVAVNGGTAPYIYKWDDANNSTTASVNNLAAGTYRVMITDNNGCSDMGSVTVDGNDAFDLTLNMNNADCFGQNTGSATVTAMGGEAPFSYQWNDPAEQTTQTATNLTAGSYFVSVFDANNCLTIGNVMIDEPTELNVNLISTDASCDNGNNGTATATVTGGTPPYEYQWDDFARQTTAMATGLAPAVYRLQVTDANGCINKSQVTVGGSASFEAKVTITDASCENPNSGAAVAVVDTGSGSYAYRWNNNETSQVINNLTAGTYTVTITDNSTGCSAVASGTVETTGNLVLSTSKNDATCGENNGTATVNITGGTAPFIYQWNDANNQTTQTATNLAAGTYMVTVSDANGCSATTNVQVLGGGNLNVSTSKNDATCGASNG